MYCNKCGAKIPDDSIFCGNCGSPVMTAKRSGHTTAARERQATPLILENLLRTLRAFFSREPESSVEAAGQSRTHEWAILLGANVLLFAFAFAFNIRQIIKTILSALPKALLDGADVGDVVSFGSFFLYGLLIALVANAIVFGAYCLMQKVIQKGRQDIIGMLNTVAASTLPLTTVFVLNMFLGLIWGFLVIPFLLTAALAQALLLYKALEDNASDAPVSFVCFLGVCLAALFLVLMVGYLFSRAAFISSAERAFRNRHW